MITKTMKNFGITCKSVGNCNKTCGPDASNCACYIKSEPKVQKIVLQKHDLIRGIERIIDEQNSLAEQINSTSACTNEECLSLIEKINRRDINEHILNMLDVQSFQYYKKDFIEIEIV